MNTEHTLTLPVSGMSCASCAARLERALAAVPGVRHAGVNLAAETVSVDFQSPADGAALAAAMAQAGYPARTETHEFDIGNLSCASCVARAERALTGVSGVLSAEVNLATETARVTTAEGQARVTDLVEAAAAAGYPLRPRQPAGAAQGATGAGTRRDAEARDLARRALIAAALALPVFLLEMGGHAVPALHHWIGRTIGHQTSWLIQFVLTTLVLIGPGRAFYRKGFPALFRGAADMNSLVALGTSAAYLFSTVVLFAPALLPDSSGAVYFEAAAVIVVLVLLGRWLEARAKGRTGDAIRALIRLRPTNAHVLRDGQVEQIDATAIRVGDIVLARPGDRIATDGVVVEGRCHVDESMITGESLPVAKQPGDPVTGGTVAGAGGLRFRATRVGTDTTLSQIVRMVEQAQGAKLPIQNLVDRVTLWFVPAVLAVAALTVAIWLLVGPAPALPHALVAGVAVLIIACPCAMGLATPTSIMVGTGRAASLGVLFRKGDALQTLHDTAVVAFDKTGTLTEGRPELTDLIVQGGMDETRILQLAAAVEAGSEHPVADAITRAARRDAAPIPMATGFRSVTGHGAAARVENHDVLIGSARFLKREGVDAGGADATADDLGRAGKTPLFVAVDGQLAAILAVADPLKPAARTAIDALHAMGLQVAMITGDNHATARAVARSAGIDRVLSEVLPGDKAAAVAELRDKFGSVAFVGDGINDAPALARADTGIAIGTGTDIAIEAADVVLMSGDPRGVVNAMLLSQRTMRNIRQNLFWAFAYNIALVPVAAGALYPAFGLMLSPPLAAAAMALSSVFVLTNALRLRFIEPALADDPGPRAPAPGGIAAATGT
ncbi:heavy metal translocating P-type ATPase [Pukyongiella litopenaei]|uniref:Copper-translocating P-type ATPase n=1 Tax=Pukyongiella litopenaei TaxID=2605946 RepID=A0A2S0MUY1_9RHOB|nr:heavy metal translocating P-type ATPase [Pukyongiella litopenaei]AVO39617.1 copper-translocating P-type ATPase [Pukyongiella litopenaei]